MWHVAVETGFEAGEDAWAGEFADLCRDHKLDPIWGGVDAALFAKLVDDKSDLGIYCTDQQLTEMLNSAPSSRPMPAQPSGSRKRPSEKRAQPPVENVRWDLLTAAFEALNWTGTGQLSADEMRPFANETGFEGTDEEWTEEFKMLLQECGENAGITLPNFAKLANDTSEDGCYCSDQDLRKLITSLEEARAETTWNDQLEPGDPKSFDKMHFEWI